MNTIGITAYGSTNGTTDDSSTKKVAASSLGMTDFLKLLAAQFQNQDISNPTSNTEFISEMAQFSALQAMSELTKSANKQYAASLVGKTVTINSTSNSGTVKTTKGVVDSAMFSSDKCSLIIGGTSYNLSDVTQVSDTAAAKTASNSADTEGA